MKLSEAQRAYTQCLGKLIAFAYAQDMELTIGDAYRDPRVFGAMGVRKGYGQASSCHKLRLACDLNLFLRGVYQTTTEAHKPLGEFWEALGKKEGLPLTWGGRFNDGNHYSMEWQGHK